MTTCCLPEQRPLPVLVGSGCPEKVPQTQQLRGQSDFSHSSGAGSRRLVWVQPGPDEGSPNPAPRRRPPAEASRGRGSALGPCPLLPGARGLWVGPLPS